MYLQIAKPFDPDSPGKAKSAVPEAIVVSQPSPSSASAAQGFTTLQSFKDAAVRFLSKGAPLAKTCESDNLLFHMSQYLTALPHHHGALALELLQGYQHEWFAQAMYLQDHIVKALVSKHNFPADFNRLSLSLIPRDFVYEMPSVEFKTAFVKLLEMQDTVFRLNVVSLDRTSLYFMMCVQILYYELLPAENKQGVAVETARMVAYDLLALSSFIEGLARFVTDILRLPCVNAKLLVPPRLPDVLMQLTSSNTPPSYSCVKSHRLRFNAMVRPWYILFYYLGKPPMLTALAGDQGRRVHRRRSEAPPPDLLAHAVLRARPQAPPRGHPGLPHAPREFLHPRQALPPRARPRIHGLHGHPQGAAGIFHLVPATTSGTTGDTRTARTSSNRPRPPRSRPRTPIGSRGAILN
jgi:hypothetical protein